MVKPTWFRSQANRSGPVVLKRDRGRYFEDADVGDEYVSPARTVTEADIAAFAALTGDYGPAHTDEEYCRWRHLGGRIAHGLLGLGMVEGLLFRVPPPEGRGLASLGWYWRFLGPIRAGDTLRLRWQVGRKRLSRGRPGHGVVEEAIRLMNQRDEVVQEGTHALLLACRQGAGAIEEADPTGQRAAFLTSFSEEGDAWTAAWERFVVPVPAASPDGPETVCEDLVVGQAFGSPRRTVAETDILTFAGITGDYAMLHTDEEYCRGTEFGRRIAHGLLGLCMLEGLRQRVGSDGGVGPGTAPLEWHWSFRKPIVPGDTLQARWTIRDIRPSRHHSGWGIVTQEVRLVNQHDVIVQEGEHARLLPRKGEDR